MSKYDVAMACGCKIKNVCRFPIENGEKLHVWNSDDQVRRPEDDKGRFAPCLSCPAKRKSKQEERKFFRDDTEETHKFGTYVVCMPVENIEK